MTTAQAQQLQKNPYQSVKELLLQNQDMLKTAATKVLPAERLIRLFLVEIRRNPKLAECTSGSLMGAAMQCSQLGLEPGPLGFAYLVPFMNRKINRLEVQLIPGYKGLMALARRSGEISTIIAHVVYKGDKFTFGYGLDPYLTHEPGPTSQRGPITHFYAAAKLKDGAAQFEVMEKEEVDVHRDRYSKAAKEGPWVTNFEEMGKKTPLRKLCKFLPVSTELQQAIILDEYAEANISQHLDRLPESKITDVQDELEQEELAEIQDKLKAQQETAKPAEKAAPPKATQKAAAPVEAKKEAAEEEPADDAEVVGGVDEPISDSQWSVMISYLDEEGRRQAVKVEAKKQMKVDKLRSLIEPARTHFKKTVEDYAKKAGVPIEWPA